jgi:small subunit ribosomal protein S17
MQLNRPNVECKDVSCPFHGNLSIRGKLLNGIVVSDRMQKSVVVRIEYVRYYKKYERYARKSMRITAHSTPCINAI